MVGKKKVAAALKLSCNHLFGYHNCDYRITLVAVWVPSL